MGEHTTFVNDYFKEAVQNRKTSFCIAQDGAGRYSTFHVTADGMTPIGHITGMSRRSELNKANVEHIHSRGRLSTAVDVKFLAVLEEIHDYYAVLNFCGYPVSFADYRLAASMAALVQDGGGTIELLGGQEFTLNCEQPGSVDESVEALHSE